MGARRKASDYRVNSDFGILVRMCFFSRRVRVHAAWIIAMCSRCLMDLLKIPSIVPQVIATIAIQANQGRVVKTDTTPVMISPFIRWSVLVSSEQ